MANGRSSRLSQESAAQHVAQGDEENAGAMAANVGALKVNAPLKTASPSCAPSQVTCFSPRTEGSLYKGYMGYLSLPLTAVSTLPEVDAGCLVLPTSLWGATMRTAAAGWCLSDMLEKWLSLNVVSWNAGAACSLLRS